MTETIERGFYSDDTDLGEICRSGEHRTRFIDFDCTDVLTEFPDANIVCVLRRSGDMELYTAELEANEGHRVLTLTAFETDHAGRIQIELRVVDGEKVLKSAIFSGRVVRSLKGEADEEGEPIHDVLDRVDAALKEADKAASSIMSITFAVDDDGCLYVNKDDSEVVTNG